MSYAQDTIISANAANALAVVLNGLLLDAGWTLVEALTPAGSNSPQTKVYKSDGGDNQAGYDWYLAMMYKGTGTESQMRLIAGGAYNAGTHLLSQIAYTTLGDGNQYFYSAPVTGDMFGAYDVNVATDATLQTPSPRSGLNVDQTWFSTIVPSSAFGYWASITLDHVSLFTTIIDPSPGPANFFAASLALDPDWVALNSADFGNGVVVNPVVMFSRAAACSGAMIGTTPSGTNPRISNRTRYANDVGSLLPILEGNWLPAYAWRDAWYLSQMDSFGATTPTWDAPKPGDGFHIGDGIDYYRVYGGSIGDTVEIESEIYVLSGDMGFGVDGTTKVYLAVLVEV